VQSALSCSIAKSHRTSFTWHEFRLRSIDLVSSWLASLLQDNPGLDELISKLLRAPFTRDEVLALNTALLLAGKFVEPRVGQSSDKGTAGIPRLVGKSKVFDMQFNWRGWSRSCPAMILLGRDVASTEEPVDFPAWKLVATASDGGLPLQKEVLLSPKTMNVFIRGFRLVKRYHAENQYDSYPRLLRCAGCAD
jgi:hypothetical protein